MGWLEQIKQRHNLNDAAAVGVKSFGVEIKSTDEKARKFHCTITTGDIDRDNEILVSEGMDASDFMKTATVFWNHNYNMPVGKAVSLTKNSNSWSSDAVIAERPKDFSGDFFPDYIWALIRQDMIKGISVGFLPVESRTASAQDKEHYGGSVERIVSKWKLLEYSIAPLQANTNAIITAVSEKRLSRNIATQLYPELVIDRRQVYNFNARDNSTKIKVTDIQREIEKSIAKKRGVIFFSK